MFLKPSPLLKSRGGGQVAQAKTYFKNGTNSYSLEDSILTGIQIKSSSTKASLDSGITVSLKYNDGALVATGQQFSVSYTLYLNLVNAANSATSYQLGVTSGFFPVTNGVGSTTVTFSSTDTTLSSPVAGNYNLVCSLNAGSLGSLMTTLISVKGTGSNGITISSF